MKRVFLFCLLLCLCLSACSSRPAPQATTEPLQPLYTPTKSDVIVKTDYSGYTQQSNTESLFTRLSEDRITDLRPSEDYGRIYPFLGQLVTDDAYYSEYRYGMADAQGCIIADPVYYSIEPLYHESETYAPFWILSKLNLSERVEEQMENFGYCYADYRYAFASLDGSVVSECKYINIAASGDRIFAFLETEDYNKPSFEVYDFEGELLFCSSELSFGKELRGGVWNYGHGEGLYLVAFENDTEYPTLDYGDSSAGEYAYYYMNEQSELVLGPYYDAAPFAEGWAAVQLENGDYTYIDRNGNTMGRRFHHCESFRDGVAIVSLKDEERDANYEVINADGESLLRSKDYIWRLSPGYYSTSGDIIIEDMTQEEGYREVRRSRCYNADFELLWEYEDCDPLNHELVIYNDYDETKPRIVNLRTGEEYCSEDVLGGCSLIGDPHAPFLRIWGSETYENYVLTPDFARVATSDTYYNTVPMWDKNWKYLDALPVIKEGKLEIYDSPGSQLGSYPVLSFRKAAIYPDGTAVIADESYTRIFNTEGELIFCYPFLSLPED